MKNLIYQTNLKKKKLITATILLLVVVLLISSLLGAVAVNPLDTLKIIWGKIVGVQFSDQSLETIVWEIRLPRVLLAIVLGGMLSLSGLILQSTLKNPLCDPYIMGTSSGAALGAAIAIVLGGSLGVSPLAFLGALLVIFIVYLFARIEGAINPDILLLSGISIGFLSSAVLTLIVLLHPGRLKSIYFWMLGGLNFATWDQLFVCSIFLFVGIIFVLFFARKLNVLILGDEVAQSLGVDVNRVRIIMLVIASLLTAQAVSVAGIIAFVGLIVPHIVKKIVGINHRYTIVLTILFGGLLLLVSDTLAKIIIANTEIPVGIITAFIGTPFFLFLLRRKKTLIRNYEHNAQGF